MANDNLGVRKGLGFFLHLPYILWCTTGLCLDQKHDISETV